MIANSKLPAVWGIVALLAGASPAAGQNSSPPSTLTEASTQLIEADIRYLSDDAREGRGTGTAGLDSAAAYIARRFQQNGLAPGGTAGYFQPFVTDPSAPALSHAGIGAVAVKNVIGVVPGKGKLAGQTVVVGAHYDHLGRGGFGSMVPDSINVIHNGADDNASGTAAVIEIGRRLVRRARTAPDLRSVLLVAFTAEELGNIGSGYYVANPVRPIDSTYAMINLDMVGRLQRDNRVMVFGSQTAAEFAALLDSAVAPYRLTVAGAGGDCFGASDHASFCSAKIPSLHVFTGIHDDYHRPSDDWERVNVEGEERVVSAVSDLAWSLATRSQPLSFVDIPAPQTVSTAGYGAYLGTVPDMASSPGGVKLQGVRSGSPAEAAGIRSGDILVRIGPDDVKDLYAMTAALQKYRPGDEVDIVIKRGEELLTLKATLGRRGG